MHDSYVVMQSVAVRRHADVNGRVVSLGRLLKEMSVEPQRITRQVVAESWEPQDAWDERDLDHEFGRWAGPAGTHLDPSIPQRDLDVLTVAASKVKAYVDGHIAHSDAKAVRGDELPSVKDMHDAIDVIGDLFRRYFLLLTGQEMATLVPLIEHDWMAVFRQPWIPHGEDFFARSPLT